MKSSRSFVAILALTGAVGFAQSSDQQTAQPAGSTSAATTSVATDIVAQTATALTLPVRGETSLTLDIGFGIRYVQPSRVTVPIAEIVRVTAPDFGPLQWRKNGRDLPGETSLTLIIPSVQSSDAGTYQAIYTDAAMAGRGSQALVLGVGPTDRLINLSTRGVVAGGGDQGLVSGFVVAAGTTRKN